MPIVCSAQHLHRQLTSATWGLCMRRVHIGAAFLLCVGYCALMFGQSSLATLGGTVSDSSGAVIPGVIVTATNTGTGIVSTVTTNETGAYQFPPLQPGSYKVSAELSGFQTYTYEGVTLGISQQVRLNFTLQVRSVAQQ